MPIPLGFRDLKVFQLAYRLAMEIFHESKSCPPEEKYSLTDQIRRSSRSVASKLQQVIERNVTPRCSSVRWLMLTEKLRKLRCGLISPATVAICQKNAKR